MARVDYDAMAGDYDPGRAISLTSAEPWRGAVAPWLAHEPMVLDLGSGTGIFANAFARWFGIRVIGIEPSDAMRVLAQSTRAHELVQYIARDAEHLPVDPGLATVAWLSTVIHHIPHLDVAAAELRRVLGTRGVVLIRSAFAGRLDHITLFKYFPGARQVAETFPSVDDTLAAFAPAGFELDSLQVVPHTWARSLHDTPTECDIVRTRHLLP